MGVTTQFHWRHEPSRLGVVVALDPRRMDRHARLRGELGALGAPAGGESASEWDAHGEQPVD